MSRIGILPIRPPTSTPPRRHRPLVPVGIGFGIGIGIAAHSANHLLWGALLSAALAALGVGMAIRWWAVCRVCLAAAGALLCGFAYTLWVAVYVPADHVARHLVATPVTLEGQILRAMQAGHQRTTLDLAARALLDGATVTRVRGRVRITAYDFAPSVEVGDLVRVHRIRLRRPSSFLNPGAFDYGRYLSRRGIYATGVVSKAERLEVLDAAGGGISARLFRVQADLVHRLNRVLGQPAAALTQAMVLGLRHQLTPEVREVFAASGTAHLMAVSGLHVGFVYAAAFMGLKGCLVFLRFRLLGRWSGGPRPSRVAALASLMVVIGYASLVGPTVPTMRATLMLATYVLAYLLERDGDPFQTTMLAALLILALHPMSLFDIGFQLSFAGVLAILYIPRLLHPRQVVPSKVQGTLNLVARVKMKLRDAALISVSASLGTAPLILYHFERLPLIAPAANLVIVPLASLAVPLALLACFTAQLVEPLGDALLSLSGILVTSIYTLSRHFAEIPFASPRVGAVSLPLIVLAYSTLLLIPYGWTRRLPRWGVVCGTLLVGAWLSWPWLFPEGRGQLQVTFLDVGHGDASFIRFPQGTTMLIDGGGSYRDAFDVGERVLAPFLWHQRVRRVDYLVATHPHPDHAKGLGFILKAFRVREFWDNGAPSVSSWYAALRQEAVRRGIYRDVVAAGLPSATIDGVHIELLHPTAAFHPEGQHRSRARQERAENNRSLVLKLTYGTVKFLFTGDIEQEAEAFLLQTGRDVHATVLKAPHHGSRTSSTEPFLHAANPSAVVFSVQRDQRFGHPHPAVLERYGALGAQTFRTDHDGAIMFRTDGQSLAVARYAGRPAVALMPPKQPLTDAVSLSRLVESPQRTSAWPGANRLTRGWESPAGSPAPPPLDSVGWPREFAREFP